ncbi:MAG: hypothetical protein IJG38_15370 [Thermoguttaceae bacterium]|nr:hypothetical protein [Thermoguttaceae bacterium]
MSKIYVVYGGLRPRSEDVFGCVVLLCTFLAFRFAFGELRNSARCARFITAFH